jgi:hypothetical protein
VIEQGQLPPEDVTKLIEAEDVVWVRVIATRNQDEWHESIMEVTSGIAPQQWSSKRWVYDDAIFVAAEVAGSAVGYWLRTSSINLDSVVINLPVLPEGQLLQWSTYSSGSSQTGYAPLLWPARSYQLAPQPLKNGPGSGSMIGNGPSFVRFAQAAATFFGVALGPGGSVDHMAPTFRRQDLSGRINKVLLGAASVIIVLEGNGLGGATVELAADTPGPTAVLSDQEEQTVEFPLPGGLPAGAWVVLKRGSDWIDRKFINYPHTLSPDPGVEMVVEPTTELQALVSTGEGATIEFKSIVPESGTSLRERVCNTVAAFANSESGGQVLFGVEDNGTIVGLPPDTDVGKVLDTVTRFVASKVAPLPSYSVGTIEVDGELDRLVLVLTVDSGTEPPYGVNPANPQYYIRRGATTFPASADQVRALARSRPPADQAYQSPYGLHPSSRSMQQSSQ